MADDIFELNIGTQRSGLTVFGHSCAYLSTCGPFLFDQGSTVYIQISADTEFTAGSGTYNCGDGGGDHSLVIISFGGDAYMAGSCEYDNLSANHSATLVVDY